MLVENIVNTYSVNEKKDETLINCVYKQRMNEISCNLSYLERQTTQSLSSTNRAEYLYVYIRKS